MDADECRTLLNKSFNDDKIINWIFQNTLEIKNKIEYYSLEKTQTIPKIEVKNCLINSIPPEWPNKYPILYSLLNSNILC